MWAHQSSPLLRTRPPLMVKWWKKERPRFRDLEGMFSLTRASELRPILARSL